MLQNELGEKIRQIRRSKGFTQEQLAELIGIDNKLAKVLDFDIYKIEDMSIAEIPQPDKIFLKSLNILHSAKSDDEKKYYLEALQHAQKGLRLNNK